MNYVISWFVLRSKLFAQYQVDGFSTNTRGVLLVRFTLIPEKAEGKMQGNLIISLFSLANLTEV